MFKKVINNEDLQKKQSEVCELVSQIWDAEALELIHGSVRSIITIKKLVMMVDASCGSSQIYTQPPIQDIGQIEEDHSEDEEDIDDISVDRCEHTASILKMTPLPPGESSLIKILINKLIFN